MSRARQGHGGGQRGAAAAADSAARDRGGRRPNLPRQVCLGGRVHGACHFRGARSKCKLTLRLSVCAACGLPGCCSHVHFLLVAGARAARRRHVLMERVPVRALLAPGGPARELDCLRLQGRECGDPRLSARSAGGSCAAVMRR